MISKPINVEALEISGAVVGTKILDPIQVFWNNLEPSEGSVTITCWGCAWTAYFRAMNDQTIQQFFAAADVYYLTTKLGITPMLKQRKADHAYLGQIITAIKETLTCSK